MTRTLTTLYAAAVLLGGIAVATAVFAEETTPSPQQRQTEGTMGDHSGMMGMMGQMSPDQMKQMTQMVDNCNRMMRSVGNALPVPGRENAPFTGG